MRRKQAKWCNLFAASCRELQAGSLCSPSIGLNTTPILRTPFERER